MKSRNEPRLKPEKRVVRLREIEVKLLQSKESKGSGVWAVYSRNGRELARASTENHARRLAVTYGHGAKVEYIMAEGGADLDTRTRPKGRGFDFTTGRPLFK